MSVPFSSSDVDWLAVFEAWSVIASSTLVAGVAITANFSLRRWRTERDAADQREVAIEALSLFLKGKDQLAIIRNPLIAASEMEATARELFDQDVSITGGQSSEMLSILAQSRRLNADQEFWYRYFDFLPRMEVFFGAGARGELEEIAKARQSVRAAIETYSVAEGEFKVELSHERFSYGGSSRPDPIAARLAQAEINLRKLVARHGPKQD
ncbi:MAG: hypothetical protein AAFR65_09060 [Pseudomonadota bacterium]